jgi:hypothetical protein
MNQPTFVSYRARSVSRSLNELVTGSGITARTDTLEPERYCCMVASTMLAAVSRTWVTRISF